MLKVLKVLPISILLLILGCQVTFNKELREYLDDVSGRTPIVLDLSESTVIDGKKAINMGYNASTLTREFTLISMEGRDVDFISFSGLSGDFTISSFEAFTLKPGESFTINITFNITATNANKLVSSNVIFEDVNGREFSFYIWATSNRQPLTIYNSESKKISRLDLGAYGYNSNKKIIIKNESLSIVNIIDIVKPTNTVRISGETSFTLGINEERELELIYDNEGMVADNENMEINTDNTLESTLTFPLYAGGNLKLSLLDSGENTIPNIDMSIASGSTITNTFKIVNSSFFPMDLTVTLKANTFLSDLGAIKLEPSSGTTFTVTFAPSSVGVVNSKFVIFDRVSGRTYDLNLVGHSL